MVGTSSLFGFVAEDSFFVGSFDAVVKLTKVVVSLVDAVVILSKVVVGVLGSDVGVIGSSSSPPRLLRFARTESWRLNRKLSSDFTFFRLSSIHLS